MNKQIAIFLSIFSLFSIWAQPKALDRLSPKMRHAILALAAKKRLDDLAAKKAPLITFAKSDTPKEIVEDTYQSCDQLANLALNYLEDPSKKSFKVLLRICHTLSIPTNPEELKQYKPSYIKSLSAIVTTVRMFDHDMQLASKQTVAYAVLYNCLCIMENAENKALDAVNNINNVMKRINNLDNCRKLLIGYNPDAERLLIACDIL